jgi:hypothetical protein
VGAQFFLFELEKNKTWYHKTSSILL